MTTYQIIGGDGRQYGPITESELRKWFAEGRLNGQSLVLREGAAEWQPLAKLAELADLFGAGNVPPPIGAAASQAEWTNRILARETDLRLGECFRSGFSFLAGNPGLVLSAVSLVWLLKFIMSWIPFVGGILELILGGVLTGGLYFVCLRRMRGEPATVGDVFIGFKQACPQLILVGVLSSILSGLGSLLCLLPGLYLWVAWSLALPLVLDQRLEFWSAMELSRKMTTRVWFQVFLLLVIFLLPVIAVVAAGEVKALGYIFVQLRDVDFDVARLLPSLNEHLAHLVKVGLLWKVMGQVALLVCQFFAVGALMRAYENLFGERAR